MTNILALPLVQLTIVTGNQEHWIDSLKYVVEDGSADPPQLDLTGIRFRMEVRRRPEENEVIISASTDDGTMALGAFPDVGFLIITIDAEVMRNKRAGAYVGDILASDGEFERVCAAFNLTIVEGITKPPVFTNP